MSMTPRRGNNVGSAFEVLTPVVTMGSAFDQVGGSLSPKCSRYMNDDHMMCTMYSQDLFYDVEDTFPL